MWQVPFRQMKTCELPTPAQPTFATATAGRLERRGMAWMIGAFVFCPCHLPITLGALALLFGGTAAGVSLRAHPYVAGAVVTILWAAGTWRGFHLVRLAQRASNARGA
jgi:Fe2+ transport system protein B